MTFGLINYITLHYSGRFFGFKNANELSYHFPNSRITCQKADLLGYALDSQFLGSITIVNFILENNNVIIVKRKEKTKHP